MTLRGSAARIALLAPLLWAGGFVLFAVTMPGPADERATDAIVVPTGGSGRIARGARLLAAGKAKRMFVSGVDAHTGGPAIAEKNGLPQSLFACCVDLGHEASDTRSNADETSAWLAARHARSVRLVTTDWHMRRALFELRRALPADVEILPDGVESTADLPDLVREYNKYLLRRVAVLGGL